MQFIINDITAAKFFKSPFSNQGRNILRAQPFDNIDFGLFKTTKVTERVNLQFQANVFNLFNHAYKGTPDVFFEDGQYDATNNPAGTFMNSFGNGSTHRTMTFGAKIIF